MESSHGRVIIATAASIGVIYLLLGVAFGVCFLLVNCGVIEDHTFIINLHNSYAMLIIVILITLLGVCTSLMVIFSVRRKKSVQILPWLVFHLLCAILITLSGIAFVLHFIINKKFFMRAALCFIPIITGLMFLCIWVKVLQELRQIKIKKKLLKDKSALPINKKTCKSILKLEAQKREYLNNCVLCKPEPVCWQPSVHTQRLDKQIKPNKNHEIGNHIA